MPDPFPRRAPPEAQLTLIYLTTHQRKEPTRRKTQTTARVKNDRRAARNEDPTRSAAQCSAGKPRRADSETAGHHHDQTELRGTTAWVRLRSPSLLASMAWIVFLIWSKSASRCEQDARVRVILGVSSVTTGG